MTTPIVYEYDMREHYKDLFQYTLDCPFPMEEYKLNRILKDVCGVEEWHYLVGQYKEEFQQSNMGYWSYQQKLSMEHCIAIINRLETKEQRIRGMRYLSVIKKYQKDGVLTDREETLVKVYKDRVKQLEIGDFHFKFHAERVEGLLDKVLELVTSDGS